ncbi:hypothetical protein HMPREF2976_08315 [Corynebacterium sp. HMSC077D10]|nr:hypothetical protein HMPREF0307_00073 [Corynebacterium sp. DNF00584]OFL78096.1 hypothetical protein HMPREF2748_02025 [Corynebacterium sp. HMSC077B05]OFN41014.1 hypothetical protein HMPREF2559_03645 [Corynebacterium sp. HMSC072G08]OFP15431.1 hypothetical protein HMPREF2998_00770 [Corynebacterium sp. HMSC065A05]OFP68672.1 hypothetical protein HMPREF2976_08315 [Corynebacterium sp. HMSC077D10]
MSLTKILAMIGFREDSTESSELKLAESPSMVRTLSAQSFATTRYFVQKHITNTRRTHSISKQDINFRRRSVTRWERMSLMARRQATGSTMKIRGLCVLMPISTSLLRILRD